MAESKEELEILLRKFKEESGKAGLKLNIKKKKKKDHKIWSHHFVQIDGETMEAVADFIFLGSKITADGDWSHEIKRHFVLGRKAMTNLDSIWKSRHYFASKDPSSQGYCLSSNHTWMWELDSKESWELKNCCFWIVVLEKTLESPLDCRDQTSQS